MNDTDTSQLTPYEILVVDDTPANLQFLTRILTKEGYRVRPASDGLLALQSVAAKVPDLILLDVKMHEMNGYDVCRRLKRDAHSRNIPVIFISALGDVSNKVEGFQAGGADYISKPFYREEVLARVKIHLELKALTEKLEQKIIERTEALTNLNQKLEEEIVERRQIEAALRESEERYRVLFEGASEAILIVDVSTKAFLYANPAMFKMLGYTEKELLSKTIYDIHPKEELRQILAEIESLTRGEKELVSDIQCVQKDGSIIYTDISANKLLFSDRECLVALFTNVTEQKRLRERMLQAQKLEAIGTLAGGVAHDFNNILAAIMGYTEITLLGIKDDPETRHNLQQVLKAGKRAKDLVQQILTFSRRTRQELKPLQISSVVIEALTLLRATLPSTIEFKQDLRSDATVLADRTQVHQVIMNICTNAGQAMQDKGGLLKIVLEEVDLDPVFLANHPGMKPGRYSQLIISDTGSGMTPEVLERIFEPFFTTKEQGKGTGLGLSVAQGIVKAHGGAITIFSTPGTGSVFNIYFPIIETVEIPDTSEKEPLPTGTECILFIDDEQAIVDTGKNLLQSLGYDVVTETSSIDALALFQKHPHKFDLVITDMTMPKMTGETLALALTRVRPDIPVILSTGFSDKFHKENVAVTGIRALIPKPTTLRELAEVTRKVLDG